MTDSNDGHKKQQGEGQMGLFGGPGPVLGGTAGGKDYSLASMLDRANPKKSGDGSANATAGGSNKKGLGDPTLSKGAQDLLEGSGLLLGAKGGWDPNRPPKSKSTSAPAAGSNEGDFVARTDVPDLHPAMSEGARNLLEGSGLLQRKRDQK
ncbi:hypothetical protein WJX75_001409 [Coccomyxa subellipsoidea]|uniref:Uncharacterized protein n=1 Tax=Coccomyxa subellipsoidea TaxID=248742 RepID=A0ABR2YZK8_9CHLO